jgi:hypothetical protein
MATLTLKNSDAAIVPFPLLAVPDLDVFGTAEIETLSVPEGMGGSINTGGGVDVLQMEGAPSNYTVQMDGTIAIFAHKTSGLTIGVPLNVVGDQISFAGGTAVDLKIDTSGETPKFVLGTQDITDTPEDITGVPIPGDGPTIDNDGTTFNVEESAPAETGVGTVEATAAEGKTIEAFDITAGNVDTDGDGELAFAIDTVGQITVNDSDEIVAANAPFALTVNVEDNAGLSTDGQFTVAVDGGPLPSPVIRNDGQTFNVEESAPAETEVGAVQARSPNGPIEAFAITEGNVDTDGDGELAFAIDTVGQITVNDSDEIVATNAPFALTVNVEDSVGQSTDGQFTIVIGELPQPPVVRDATFSVEESAPADTEVGTVQARSPDGSIEAFAITAGNVDTDGDGELAFAINNTGLITVNDSDEITDANAPFALTVSVEDNFGASADGQIEVVIGEAPEVINLEGETSVSGTPGVQDIFVLGFDSTSGRMVATGTQVTITNFTVGEDLLRFDDDNAVVPTAEAFLDFNNGGINPVNDGFDNQTMIYFQPTELNVFDPPPASITLAGVSGQIAAGENQIDVATLTAAVDGSAIFELV